MRDRSVLGFGFLHALALSVLCLHCGDDDPAGPPGSQGSSGSSGNSASGGGGPGTNPGVPVSYTCKREIHVSPSGNDAKSGATVEEAKKTIAATTKKAEPGDCIKVHTGTYAETSTITFGKDGTKDAPIVLWASDGKGTAIIDGSGNSSATVFLSEDFVIIDGFDFKNTPTDSGEQVIHIDGKDKGKGNGSALRNNKITGGHDHVKLNQQTSGVTIEGNEFYGTFGHIPISLTGADNLVFRGNYCHDWDVGEDGAIQIKGGSHDSVFDGNRFENVDTLGGAITLGDGCDSSCDNDPEHYAGRRLKAINNVLVKVGRAFDINGCVDCAVLSNTIVDSGPKTVLFKLKSVETGGVTRPSKNARIVNNLIANPSRNLSGVLQANDTSGEGMVMDHNLYWNGGSEVEFGGDRPSGADAHSVTGQDPKFTSATDFSLAPGSPAIGKGQNLVSEVASDFVKSARPAAAPFDIGAFQTK